MTRKAKTNDDAPVDADQANSDPLPYTQVDRAVKPTAALIASKLGITFQHALGGLVEFWQLNGDPRDLEALLAAGKTNVALPRDEVARRFALAMAIDTERVSPEELASLRLLEQLPDGTFRVRGMSRYFLPLQRRVVKRLAGRVGGLASAEVRAKKHGTAQPKRSGAASGRASAGASSGGSKVLRDDASSRRSNVEASPNTAVSGQRSSSAAAAPTPAISAKAADPSRAFFSWAQDEARKRQPQRTDDGMRLDEQDTVLGPPLQELGRKGLERAWLKFLEDPYAQREGYPMRLFAKQAQSFHNKALTTPPAGVMPEDWKSLA